MTAAGKAVSEPVITVAGRSCRRRDQSAWNGAPGCAAIRRSV